jgi:glutamine---fructose-6-phosphate transaminase (isomerizing)
MPSILKPQKLEKFRDKARSWMTRGVVTKRELLSQPERWQALLSRTSEQDWLPKLELKDFGDILVFGSGSSYYLAMLVAELIESVTGIRARPVPSCEIFLCQERYLKLQGRKGLAVGISRSGESSEAILAGELLKEKGFSLLVIGCYETSTLAARADYRLTVPEGQEEGLAMLRSFTSMLLGFQLFLAGQREVEKKFYKLPIVGERLIDVYTTSLTMLANKRDFRRFVFLGSGIHFPLTFEAGLKMQEMAIATSEAYHSLEYRHGPKSTAASDTLVTLFALDGDTYGIDLVRDLKAYDVTTLVIGENVGVYREVADETLELESGLNQADRLILTLLPAQLLAFETSLRLGQNPDVSRNLSQVVKF